MGELYNPYPKLPKNIRQIGDRDDVVKLYVEDYVNTYLKRLYPAGGQDLRVGLLLGSVEQHDGTSYIFVDGALEMEDVTVTGEKVAFAETSWKKAYQSIEDTFPKRTVQGWFLCGAPGCSLSPLNYWKQHGQYFSGKNQMMYLNGGIDGDESIYITSDDGFYRVKGYSVYYERNQMMQDYMIQRKDARRVESGANDRVIRDFKQRMEGRKKDALSRRGTIKTLGLMCSVLSVAVLAGGVVMLNNYQKMKEMETVLVSVLPSGVNGWKDYELGGDDDIVVEEIKSGISKVTGTDGSGAENMPGQAAVQPEQMEPAGAQPEQMEPAGAQPEQIESAGAQPEQIESTGAQPEPEAQIQTKPVVSVQPVETQPIQPLPEQAALPETSPAPVSGGNATAMQDFPVTNMKPGESYIVGDGETLYGICFKLYDNVKYLNDICALNQITDENKITSGQKLILPDLTGIQ